MSSAARVKARATLLTAVAMLAFACTSQPPSPSPAASPVAPPATEPSEPTFAFSVRDRSGLVAASGDAPQERDLVRTVVDVAVANPGGSTQFLHVAWLSLPCELDATVLVEGTPRALRINVYRGASIPEDCEAMGIVRSVVLRMAVPVHAAHVKPRVHTGRPPPESES